MDGEACALQASKLVQSTLCQAGFITYPTKSIWKPTQRLQWLGFVVDLEKGHIKVPVDRVTAVQAKLQEMHQRSQIVAKQLAGVVGSILSMGLANGLVSHFMTRSMYALLETRCSWWDMLKITPKIQQEIVF